MMKHEQPRAKLTRKQWEFLRVFIWMMRRDQYQPSSQELADYFKCSSPTIAGYLSRLERKRWVETGGAKRSRAVHLNPIALQLYDGDLPLADYVKETKKQCRI